jgi:hypothetical protein
VSDEESVGLDGVEVCSGSWSTKEEESETSFFNPSLFWQQLKSNAWSGGKLVPFIKTFALYFALFIPEDKPSWRATTIKCLPILSLALFVLLHGITQ